ncbi:circularly permuted type 2 ATP-grasp protein [Lentisalinibacter salinarum]|uniref:circularly permuted type 2 ATP-grasp protein n=1 Tax=Lentisalinibacter salinarum TaxID=2992239 RepID=UPI00386FB107
MPPRLTRYDPRAFHDELVTAEGDARPGTERLIDLLNTLTPAALSERQAAADRAIAEMGITFTVYSEGRNIDRAWPFDIVPRVIPASEWARIDEGLRQRLTALNLFIDDLYNDKHVVRDGVFPADVLGTSRNYLPECAGVSPRFGVWAHICGSDLVRDGDGTVYVLEDNLRVPSGVSYMLENRSVTKRVFPDLFEDQTILPVDDYPSDLFDLLTAIAPTDEREPEVVVLTPGIYNSAYFEHSYLAQRMGAELVEGGDLVVGDDDCVYMRTIEGLTRVHSIYRRIDDTFLDPQVFRADSMLGVPGLMRAWRSGNVALANAPGSGVADDKMVYTYVPELIRYYLDQDPIIPNVPTWRCAERDQREHVLANLAELVVKPANESGGYGMLIGPRASRAELARFRELIEADPRNYIAQPTLALSTTPTVRGEALAPRHVDLRPFILQSDRLAVTAGGLTRVALVEGSLVVNSSQGGGSKDTWIVEDRD